MWVKEFIIKENAPCIAAADDLVFQQDPDLILYFADYDRLKGAKCVSAIHEKMPHTMIVGATTGTAICGNNIAPKDICGLAFGFDKTTIKEAHGTIDNSEQSHELGSNLASQLKSDDLVAIILICDGLFINGDEIINGMVDIIGSEIPISGGLSGDGERFKNTRVYLGNREISQGAIAIGLYSKNLQVSHASYGGWYEFGPEWRITKSKNNIVEEIEDMPAIELYDDYVGTEKMALQASALLYPLKVWPPNQPDKGVVRAVMQVDRKSGALTFAGDVPQGWTARLMHGNQPGLIDGAKRAAKHAFDEFKFKNQFIEPQACLIVSCVARHILLGSRTNQEIIEVANVIGTEVPIGGFYSYGEIAPQNDSTHVGLHNQTMTLTLMAEY